MSFSEVEDSGLEDYEGSNTCGGCRKEIGKARPALSVPFFLSCRAAQSAQLPIPWLIAKVTRELLLKRGVTVLVGTVSLLLRCCACGRVASAWGAGSWYVAQHLLSWHWQVALPECLRGWPARSRFPSVGVAEQRGRASRVLARSRQPKSFAP